LCGGKSIPRCKTLGARLCFISYLTPLWFDLNAFVQVYMCIYIRCLFFFLTLLSHFAIYASPILGPRRLIRSTTRGPFFGGVANLTAKRAAASRASASGSRTSATRARSERVPGSQGAAEVRAISPCPRYARYRSVGPPEAGTRGSCTSGPQSYTLAQCKTTDHRGIESVSGRPAPSSEPRVWPRTRHASRLGTLAENIR